MSEQRVGDKVLVEGEIEAITQTSNGTIVKVYIQKARGIVKEWFELADLQAAAAPAQPAVKDEEVWLAEFVTAAVGGTGCLRSVMRAFAANLKTSAAQPARSDEGRPCSEIMEPPLITGRPLTLQEWLTERLQNARRLADEKTGADREGWLEDARYFDEALKAAQPAGELRREVEKIVKRWKGDDTAYSARPIIAQLEAALQREGK